MMEYVSIQNGLGNQMSQYAFYLNKKRSSINVRCIINGQEHNGFELNKIFGLNICSCNRLIYLIFRILAANKYSLFLKPLQKVIKCLGFGLIDENYDYSYHNELLGKSSRLVTFFIGGWHHYNYINPVRDDIKSLYKFPEIEDCENKKISELIRNTNSISIHIRRGDYLKPSNQLLFADICNIDYYQRAVSIIEKKVNNPYYFIFSDDMNWVKENLKLRNMVFVEINQKESSWKDMYLMTLCKGNIIANSTFSWWGAYLNIHEDSAIVISPKVFIKTDNNSDIYCPNWIKI